MPLLDRRTADMLAYAQRCDGSGRIPAPRKYSACSLAFDETLLVVAAVWVVLPVADVDRVYMSLIRLRIGAGSLLTGMRPLPSHL